MNYYLKTIKNDNSLLDCVITVIELPNEHQEEFTYQDAEITFSVKHHFWFGGLRLLREQLETLQKKIACKGARIDTHPTNALLHWEEVYLLEMGKKPTIKYHIFEQEEDYSKIAYLHEQETYYDKWWDNGWVENPMI